MAVLSKARKPDNFESYNYLKRIFAHIFELLVRILLDVNLPLNQTFLTFMLYVRQTWMTQFIVTISL